MTLVAGFIHLGWFDWDGFEKYPAGPADFIKLFRNLVTQIIKDECLGRISTKTGAGTTSSQIHALAIADPDLDGQGIVHWNTYRLF